MSVLRTEAEEKFKNGEKHLYLFDIQGKKNNTQVYAVNVNHAIDKAHNRGVYSIERADVIGRCKEALETRYFSRYDKFLTPLYSINKNQVEEFITTDVEKAVDFLELTKEEFLQSYSYLTEAEYNYNEALYLINRPTILANLMRKAENVLLEEVNNRPTGLAITSENIKTAVSNKYLELPKHEQVEFEDLCEAMAC